MRRSMRRRPRPIRGWIAAASFVLVAVVVFASWSTQSASPTNPAVGDYVEAYRVDATQVPRVNGEFTSPCIDAPYDGQYADDDLQVYIRRFEQSGITYFVADVQTKTPSRLRAALSGETMATVSQLAERSGAVFAINADDYGVHKYGTIIRNGQLLRTHDTTRNMLIVDENGDFSVRVERSTEDPAALGEQLLRANTWQTFEFGPELIRDGQAVEFSPEFDLISTAPSRREPRTAIGQIAPLHYVVIVADGRQSGYSKGMTLGELQHLFLRYGVQTAINLDGGGSSEMWFQGSIVNRPSQGEERRLSDILYF